MTVIICKSLTASERSELMEIVNKKAKEFIQRHEITTLTENTPYEELTETLNYTIQTGDHWERAEGLYLRRLWWNIFNRATGNYEAHFFAWGNLCKY